MTTTDLENDISSGRFVHLKRDYDIDRPVTIPSDTHVQCDGVIKWVGPEVNPLGHMLKFAHGSRHSSWRGGIIDANLSMNNNGLAISTANNAPTENTQFITVDDLTVMNTRIEPNKPEFGGGGKGLTIQFRVANCRIRATLINCDYGFTLQTATTLDRWVHNIQADLTCIDCLHGAVFLSGSLPQGYRPEDPFTLQHTKFGQCNINLHAQGCGTDGRGQIVADYAVFANVQGTVIGGNPKVWTGGAAYCKTDISYIHQQPSEWDTDPLPGHRQNYKSRDNNIIINDILAKQEVK